MQSQQAQPARSARLYTIMTDATNRDKAVLVYVGPWETLQVGAVIEVEEARYQVVRAAVTINRRGGQTQEVVLKRSP